MLNIILNKTGIKGEFILKKIQVNNQHKAEERMHERKTTSSLPREAVYNNVNTHTYYFFYTLQTDSPQTLH